MSMRFVKSIGENFAHPSFAIGFGLSVVLVFLALISTVWTPHPTDIVNIANRFAAPSFAHWFGTDFFGRDIFSMLMAGALTSLRVAILAVVIGMVVGVPLGLLAAGHGGWPERLILRLNDFVFAFPAIITAIIITTLFGPSAINAMIAIGIFNIPVFARVARGGALSIWTLDYVDAARLAGLNIWRISLRHVLPNILSLLIVQATIQLSLGILAEAGLSYIGLGTQPPETSLGLMLKEAQSFFLAYPTRAVWPGVTIIVFVLALNLMGDGLRDQMDPRLTKAGGVNVTG